MGKDKNKFDFDSGSIFIYMIRKAKILIIVSLAAFIVSAVVSLMITPKYKSTVVLFPATSASISKSILNNSYLPYNRADLLNFGDENDCDQLMQVLISREIMEMINKKYNLMAHYGIDIEKTDYPQTKYYEYFESNFVFRRTEYNSIVISVFDTEPELASTIANSIASYADTLIRNMRKSRGLKAYELAFHEYSKFDSLTKATNDSMNKLTKLGIYNYKDQSKELSKAYFKALGKGKNELANKYKKDLEVVARYGISFNELNRKQLYNVEQRSSIFYKLQEIKSELDQNLPSNFVVESAVKADKKAYPKRMIIVLISTIAAFFLTFILLVFIDSIKKHF